MHGRGILPPQGAKMPRISGFESQAENLPAAAVQPGRERDRHNSTHTMLGPVIHAFYIARRGGGGLRSSAETMLTGRDIARRVEGRTEVRTSPLRGRLRLTSLATADDHAIELTFACGMTGLDSHVERQMLTEAFL